MNVPTIRQAAMALVIAIVFAIIAQLAFNDPGVTLAIAIASLLSGLLAHLRLPMKASGHASSHTVGSGETTTLFVGNLAFRTTPDELQALFSPFGPIQSVRIMKDRMTRRPRGFAFVELSSRQAGKAIRKLHDSEFNGRKLKVNESNKSAQPGEGEKSA